MKIAFVWQGVHEHMGRWNDGLREAMRHIEKEHEVRYYDPRDEIEGDVVFYWEAPVTIQGKNGEHYRKVQSLPIRKFLLFAGGQVRREWVDGFELVFVESQINEDEFGAVGVETRRAFGVNERVFKPEKQPKIFDGIHHATYAGWKRHKLFAEALGERGVACGRKQEHEPQCYEVCEEHGVLTLPELPPEAVASIINASHTVVNTSEFWGGGQRCTLEAMACDVPPIVMSDSPKNREYVEESGVGAVVDPEPNKIREAVENIKGTSGGRDYIMEKWTSRHYADAILETL